MLFCGKIGVRGPCVCAILESAPASRMLSPQVRCLFGEGLAIGSKTGTEACFVKKAVLGCRSCSRGQNWQNGSCVAMKPLVSLFCDSNV